jgi:hypothetical protein
VLVDTVTGGQKPSRTVLYKVIAGHLETFLASFDDNPDAPGWPAYVQWEFYDYLQHGILAHGFSAWVVTPVTRRGCCPSVAIGRGGMNNLGDPITSNHLPHAVGVAWIRNEFLVLR